MNTHTLIHSLTHQYYGRKESKLLLVLAAVNNHIFAPKSGETNERRRKNGNDRCFSLLRETRVTMFGGNRAQWSLGGGRTTTKKKKTTMIVMKRAIIRQSERLKQNMENGEEEYDGESSEQGNQ